MVPSANVLVISVIVSIRPSGCWICLVLDDMETYGVSSSSTSRGGRVKGLDDFVEIVLEVRDDRAGDFVLLLGHWELESLGLLLVGDVNVPFCCTIRVVVVLGEGLSVPAESKSLPNSSRYIFRNISKGSSKSELNLSEVNENENVVPSSLVPVDWTVDFVPSLFVVVLLDVNGSFEEVENGALM